MRRALAILLATSPLGLVLPVAGGAQAPAATSQGGFVVNPAPAVVDPHPAREGGSPRISAFPAAPQGRGDPYTSPDSLSIGGLYGGLANGTETNGGGSLTIRGAPYGYYDTGTLLSLVTTERPLTGSRAGVNGGFEAGVPAMAKYGGYDMVSLYNQTMALPPRLVLHDVRYTANPSRIDLGAPLTATQLAALRRSMWVSTNSYDPTLAHVTPARLAAAAHSGDAALTLSGRPAVAAGEKLAGFGLGLDGPAVLVQTVRYDPRHDVTVIGLSMPLVTMPDGAASWAAGTLYSFESRMDGAERVSAVAADTQPSRITYGSTITGWDPQGRWIAVNGWTVPGSGHAAPGQLPTTLLDPDSPYGSPTVAIGAPTGATAENWVSSYDPYQGDAKDSQVSAYTGLELDQWNFGKLDYAATFQGLTIEYSAFGQVSSGAGRHAVKPGANSYELLLFGGNMPTMLAINGDADTNEIKGDSVYVHGNGGASNARKKQEMNEFSAYVDGTDDDRIVEYQSKDGTGIGWAEASVHLGLEVNGHQGQLDGGNGGELVFNNYDGASHNNGGLALVAGSGKVGISIPQSGRASFPNGMTASAPIVFPTYAYRALPHPQPAGAQVLCTDCRKPGEGRGSGTGMMVFADGHAHWVSIAGSVAAE